MASKYLKITNKTGFVPRINLEKLGLSTKRNDPGTIGQFGSGIKFAPIAALRNGWEWWFVGTDSLGQYKLRYTKVVEDGVECVAYDYGDYQKSSSFTIDAGCLSWVTPFQIYREAVANAFDDGNWSIDVVDASELNVVDGEFSVFISAAPELIDVHNNFDKYFANNRKVVYQSGGVKFLEKIDEKLRIYSHNVLVHESDQYESIYDYNIDDIRLNEERNLASLWDAEWTITGKIPSMTSVEQIEKIIRHEKANFEPFELQKILSAKSLDRDNVSEEWFDAFVNVYGENCAIYDEVGATLNVQDSIKLRGFNPVFISSQNLYCILKAAEVRNYVEVLGEEYHLNTDFDLSPSKYPHVAKAIDIVSSYIPEIKDLVASQRLGVFTSDLERNLGITINASKDRSERMIFINSNHAHDSVESIVATIVHEYDHLDTGYNDSDYRYFRDVADRRIASLMMKFYDPKFYELDQDVIIFPMDKSSHLGSSMLYTITQNANISIITVGDRTFISNPDIRFSASSGVLKVSTNGVNLLVPDLCNVKHITCVK
jgi:hypothetical protein